MKTVTDIFSLGLAGYAVLVGATNVFAGLFMRGEVFTVEFGNALDGGVTAIVALALLRRLFCEESRPAETSWRS